MVAMNTAVVKSAIYDKVEDAPHLGSATKIPSANSALLRDYDDGPGGPRSTRAKERAFRQGFIEEARRVVRDWAHPFEEMSPQPSLTPVSLSEGIDKVRFNPTKEIDTARNLRLRVRERYAVYGAAYGPDCAGRKTYHLGYRPGHEAPAARLRGRHHALEYVIEPLRELDTSDVDTFDPLLLGLWLKAVEEWAVGSMRPRAPMPPPRLLEVPGTVDYLARMGKMEPEGPSIDRSRVGGHAGDPAESRHTGNDSSIGSVDGSLKTVISEPSPAMHSQSCPPPQPRRLQLTRADQIEIRPPDWLLRGMLERDTFALIFGDPGCGKSFLAIDWACRIATGTPWRDQAVKAGPVVYIAGEGQNGFGRRIRAWQQHNDVSLDEKPLYLSPAVAMPDPADLVALVTAIDTGVAAVGGMPAMIVLDTLARNFGSGDESSTQDMTRFVASCDVIRKRYGCTVLVVHHTGHADKSRARGAMALKAAIDVEYRLDKTAKHEGLLTATKMKDAEEPDPMGLSLVTVELPGLVDDYGNPVTSAAVEVATADIEAIAAQAETARRRGKWQKHGLHIAKRLVEQSETGWVDVFEWRSASGEAGMSRQTQLRVLETMAEYGEIVRHGDRIRLPNDD